MKAPEGLSTLSPVCSALWRRGDAPGRLVLLPPSRPSTNCPPVPHEVALTPVSAQRRGAHAHAHVCPKRSPFHLTPLAQFHLIFNSVRSLPCNLYSEHMVFLNLQKISWLLVKYCSTADTSNLSRATVTRYLGQLNAKTSSCFFFFFNLLTFLCEHHT